MKLFLQYLQEKAAVNATQFEGHLVDAFNAASTEGREIAKKGKRDRIATPLAQKCVDSLQTQINGRPRKAWKTSGGGGSKKLTAAYTSGGEGKSVKSGEPKTDVVFLTTASKLYRCSVKYGHGAQLVSAQTNEMYAVIGSVFGASLAVTAAEIISQTGSSTQYAATRKKFQKMYGEDAFDALISKVLGLKSGAGAVTKAEIAQMNEFLDALGVTERVSMSMNKFMTDSKNRKALLREFITGERRFADPNYVADHFLEWFDNGTVRLMDVNTFITKTLPHFKFSLRSRGPAGKAKTPGGERPSRGIAWRVDIADKAPVNEELVNEYRQILDEGLRDWFAAAGEFVRAGWEKFVGAIRRAVDFFARLLAAGVDKFMQFIGIVPETMEYTWA